MSTCFQHEWLTCTATTWLADSDAEGRGKKSACFHVQYRSLYTVQKQWGEGVSVTCSEPRNRKTKETQRKHRKHFSPLTMRDVHHSRFACLRVCVCWQHGGVCSWFYLHLQKTEAAGPLPFNTNCTQFKGRATEQNQESCFLFVQVHSYLAWKGFRFNSQEQYKSYNISYNSISP